MSTARSGMNPTTSCISQTVGVDILQASVNGAAQVYTLEQVIPARAVVLQRWTLRLVAADLRPAPQI